MPRRNTVNMEVPEELADQIQQFMAQLQVGQPMDMTGNEDVDEDGTILGLKKS